MQGKDAALSLTNISAVISMIAMLLASQEYYVDESVLTGIVSFATTLYGRWRAGGFASVFGISLRQKPKEGGL